VDTRPLTCLALNCSLKPQGGSSTDRLLGLVLDVMAPLGVTGEVVRVAAHVVSPGVTAEAAGPGDEWPAIRQKVLDADILLVGTPIWMGNPSSVCRRVLERLDAFLSETDGDGRQVLSAMGKVAAVCVVGNEDGAHTTIAQCYQAMADVGFTFAAAGAAYWVGEAMGSTDFKDLDEVPERVRATVATMAANVVHLARLLEATPYPPPAAA
jgi:multimeric flavodoxin WrbA